MATLCAETNAILKLDLGSEGGIRRISLAKLWDPVNSCVSYQRLSEMALQYSNLLGSKLHRVTVTYNDEDGDIITISTDEELTDAFEQFSTRVPPIVRAKASFNVEKNGEKIVNGLKQAVSEITETVKNGDGDDKKSKANQVQDILDSFMTILTQAVDTLSKNIDGAKQSKKKRVGSTAIPKEVRARNTVDKARGSTINCGALRTNRSSDVNEGTFSKVKTDGIYKGEGQMEKKQENISISTQKEVKAAKDVKEDHSNVMPAKTDLNKSFIHGRHTCDGCLASPIIGIRYHALNLPDHDLCEMCIQKYTRKDVIFEPTELERDRYLQEKWKRRQRKWKAGGRFGNQISTENPPGCSVDSALKEAIRRSLEDVEVKTRESSAENKNPNAARLPEDSEMTGEKEEVNLGVDEDGEDIVMDEEEEIVMDVEEKDSLTGEEEEQIVMDVEDKENITDEQKEEILVDMEEKEVSMDEEDTDGDGDEDEDEDEDEGTGGDLKLASNEINQFSEETSETTKKKIDEQETSMLQLEEELTDVSPIVPTSTKSHNSSFAEDAEGQGDVAVAIGKALDVTANAIDAVVSEVEKSFDDTINENQSKAGCTILGSVNTANRDAKSVESSQSQSSVDSNDEWQVLDEDKEVTSVTSDEMMSQAAQLLGSALFQSDVISDVTEAKDERTNKHNVMSGSSLLDSVPTDVPTIASRAISSVLLSRWDTELKQLHELGFLDDESNVNALAHLEAANMGVECNDPVTVDAAVDYLLSKYDEHL